MAYVRCVRNARTFRECEYLCVREQKQKKVKKCSISRKVSKICCIFAPDFKTYQYMNTVGVIGTGAAFVNYRDKKAAYDALVEQHDVLNAVYATYNEKALFEKYTAEYDQIIEEVAEHDLANELNSIERNQNNRPDGLKVTTLLRVANLVGNKFFKASNTFYFTNCGNEDIYVNYIEFQCNIINPETNKIQYIPLIINKSELKDLSINSTIKVGETKSFSTGTCYSGGSDEVLRKIVCNACGKKLITSCPKISINNIELASFRVHWGKNGRDVFYTNDQPGVLRYVGEAGI